MNLQSTPEILESDAFENKTILYFFFSNIYFYVFHNEMPELFYLILFYFILSWNVFRKFYFVFKDMQC